MKLKTKNLLMILLPVLVLFSAVMGYSVTSQYRTDKSSSETMAEMTSRQYGDRVAAFLASPLDAARTVADMTAGYIEAGTADRKAVDAALKKILETNEDFFGVWVGFEPNAFDAKDANYANTAASDATGRYIPYWYREEGGVALAVLENYTAAGDGDYYQLAFKSGSETILEPFSYEVGGKTVQMTSLTVPIFVGGKVVGVAGVDISLEKLQQITDELELYKTGFGRLLTGTGTVVTHHDQTLVGTTGEEFDNGDPDGLIARINDADTFSQTGKLFKSYAPIDIGRTGSHWCFGTVIPEKEILAELNTTMGLLLLIALVGLGALAGVIVFISGSISDPIIVTTGIIQRLSGFDFRSDGSSAADKYARREDEIGIMLQSIQSMQRNMQVNLLEKLSNISQGDLDDEIVMLGDQDQIGPALADTQNAIKSLVSDVNALAGAAVEGRLDARADAARHQGQYAKVVDGVNRTLDAVVAPVTEAGSVLDKMANGDLTVRMDGDYRGDHAAIKVALNSTLDSVSTYVGEISSILTQMAGANFNVGVEADYKGDFAPIKTALNLIVETFNKVLAEMNTAAEQVSIGSRQVSEGSQALSQGATEQASSIEQLTASIRVVADQTRDNAVHAGTAHQLSSKTKLQATQGSDVMTQMRTAMAEISESSARIAQVIKVIDDIAFQTNMLSLNAAVEAARAGANGKGFAVVAEEVRDLAGRCAKAAKETAAMIEESIAKVNAGSKLTEKTAQALNEIVSEVVQVEDLVGIIAEASNDQASAITEINQGVMQVSEVVRMNSSTSEESAATSEELSGQADMLKQMIAKFKLKES